MSDNILYSQEAISQEDSIKFYMQNRARSCLLIMNCVSYLIRLRKRWRHQQRQHDVNFWENEIVKRYEKTIIFWT